MIGTTNRRIQLMLTGGVIAGPLYIIVGGAQILMREGFDITRHPLSFMTLGDLGWIQITNFIVTGVLTLLAAITLRRLAQADRRLRWGALLIGIYALGVIGGGIFVPDPALGFPPGTPDTYLESMSWHGLLHFISGAVGFFSLIAACFVYARYFAVYNVRQWGIFSALTGAIYLAAIVATIATANESVWALALLYVAVTLGWLWISAICARTLKRVSPAQEQPALSTSQLSV